MKSLTLIESKGSTLPAEQDYLWRYFDIHKFLNLLQNKTFRFSRMDQFEDPLEGIPLHTLIAYQTNLDLNIVQNSTLSELILDESLSKNIPVPLRKRLHTINIIQKATFVTCWFAEPRESVAMWNLYSNTDGVALKIPFGKLKRMLKVDVEGMSAYYGGRVKYMDFSAVFPKNDRMQEVTKVALRKDNSFKHESEFRFVVRLNDHHNDLTGINSLPLDLKKCALKVVCHPRMPEWKKQNVRTLLKSAGLAQAYQESEIRLRDR